MPHDGVRVSTIIDVESVTIRAGIIGCDGQYRVDWCVPINRGVVGVHGVPQTTTWKEELPWHVGDWVQARASRPFRSLVLSTGEWERAATFVLRSPIIKGHHLLRLSTIMLNTGEKCGAGKEKSGIGDNSDQPR